jgi:hypothetical protein
MTDNPKNSQLEAASWHIKGVSSETRAAVRKAARQAGKTIGEWVDEALRRAASQDLAEHPPDLSREHLLSRVLEAIERQENRLDALEQRRRRSWVSWLLKR